jgi:hypothetical protein
LLPGIDSLAVDMKDGKMTVTGLVDPVDVVTKLRRNNWPSAQIVSIGPWPEKKKDDASKKEGGGDKKDGGGDKKAEAAPKLAWYPPPPWYDAQQPQLYYPQYVIPSAEEDPNSCVIC